MARHFGPRADAHPVRLLHGARGELAQRGLAVAPHALLERAAQLRLMGLAHQVVALVIEGGVQEEALVLELEVLFGLADPALAQGQQLLAFGEGADGDRPFLKSNWHSWIRKAGGLRTTSLAHRSPGDWPAGSC